MGAECVYKRACIYSGTEAFTQSESLTSAAKADTHE